MSVKKLPSGERSVEAEVEVPGTPEEVWKAIATGPGMSSWLVPSTCEERVGGKATNNFGPGMEAVAAIKTWSPPHSFVAEALEGPGTVATEWIVEARDGGKCVVRVVHRWFADTDNWDDQFVGHTYGWQAFFRILRLYLAHFKGQKCSSFQLAAFSPSSVSDVWRTLLEALAVKEGSQKVKSTPPAPALSGVIERKGEEPHPELLVRIDSPAPGVAHFFPMPMGGQVLLSIRYYLYGDQGAAAISAAEGDWANWLAKQYPPAGAPA
jgi:uncharacterized protein YndB with AHSA1/START domain